MAGVDIALDARRDWPLANPWTWTGVGLAACGLALLLTRTLGVDAEGVSVLLVFFGLVSVGAAVALRLNFSDSAALNALAPPTRALLLFLLTVLFAALALAATAVVVLSFFNLDWLPWHTGQAVLLWVVTVPLAVAAALRARGKRGADVVAPQEEAAALLLLAALAGFVSCWALYFGQDDPTRWDTMRLFLAVATGVALLAAPLVAAPLRTRRAVLSILFVLHFAGIVTATLAAPPSPWLVLQAWNRIYRPYLEFMYLNNAYHFYAPEPGPATYLWLRHIYEEDGVQRGVWEKVPRVDEKTGQQQHAVALEYQRYLALTENVTPTDNAPQFTTTSSEGQLDFTDFYRKRLEHAPQPLIIGKQPAKLVVPFHPFLTHAQQYAVPSTASKRLFASYARHAARAVRAEHPEWKYKGVKVYRVRHEIPPVEPFAKLNFEANDPELYRPYYQGMYDADGRLIDQSDPFLYWLLPVLRENSADPNAEIRDFARLHAGDSRWVRPAGEKTVWVEGAQPH